ncbi:MAG: nickel-dependent hydrogenase large subunit [Desulfohalobiaceae bacterium]|nr:nickel-dependent hydrogenase large subunit [Desulfohalobiaceae bacterium]
MTKETQRISVPLNRAEGDLEVHVDVRDGIISDAWSSGTMFRGFEDMMTGRGALDGLVFTPRICGVCSLTHLTAAVEALDAVTGVKAPDNAQRQRNLALMAETIQSDVRQSVLMFMVDFANREAYGSHPLSREAYERYAPLAGTSSLQVIQQTKHLLQIVSIIGGQWPHTSFMVPGGVTSTLEVSEILQCRMVLEHFRKWYEEKFLGCTLERWQAVTSAADLEEWLEESRAHRESEVGFFLRFARQAGLDEIGGGHNRFLSYGSLPLPSTSAVSGTNGQLLGAGFANGTTVAPFDPNKIGEDTSHSWYTQDDASAHPSRAGTRPYASGPGGEKYSWVKAPRYDETAVETGPLAEMIVDNDPLFHDLLREQGPNVVLRQLARLTRPARLLPAMLTWLHELDANHGGDFYHRVDTIPDGEGAGLLQAARGALGHWIRIVDEKIDHYQVITPSTWNGSPRDEKKERGAWEEALIGTPVRDPAHPVEAGHVVRSFDPCLVCAVHSLRKGKKVGRVTLNGGL